MTINEDRFRTLRREFGRTASWAVWCPDVCGAGIQDLTRIAPAGKPSPDLHSRVVFVGLNPSRDLLPGDWSNFHDGRRYSKDRILAGLLDAAPWRGAYMTDLVKNLTRSVSTDVMSALRAGAINIEEHVRAFRAEMRLLGADERTLFIAVGKSNTWRLFTVHLRREFPNCGYVHNPRWGRKVIEQELRALADRVPPR